MNIYKAKYEALLKGIDDPALVENAEKLVGAAVEISQTTAVYFGVIMQSLLATVDKIKSPINTNFVNDNIALRRALDKACDRLAEIAHCPSDAHKAGCDEFFVSDDKAHAVGCVDCWLQFFAEVDDEE